MIIKPSRCLCANSTETLIQVPRQTTFHVPRGRYSAHVHSVRKLPSSNGPRLVRIVFKIAVAGSSVDYLAKIDHKEDLSEGTDLWCAVSSMLGRRTLQECSEGQFDLNRLINMPADIEVEHIICDADSYDHPLVVISSIEAPGTLVSITQGRN